MPYRSERRDGVAAGVVAAGFATWFWTTAWSNHPVRSFDRLRRLDRWGVLLPNWRFFAPTPATHDFHILYRTQSPEGAVSEWGQASEIATRTWQQGVFFPGRRREKAIFDIVGTLLQTMGTVGLRGVERFSSYRVLQSFVEHEVRARHGGTALPDGFQFAIVQYTGYDEEPDPIYLLVSSFVPLEPPVEAIAA